MRARLLPFWPVISETYHLRPFDFDRLSGAEWHQYLDALEVKADEARRQSRK